jgi:gluconolactonase
MTEFRELASGLSFPEGPVALDDGSVLVAEMQTGQLTRVGPDGAKSTVARIGGGPNGAAMGPGGKSFVCNNGGVKWQNDEHGLRPAGQAPGYRTGSIDVIDLQTGGSKTLYEEVGGRRLCSPNDIVFDAHGGFWFTDSGKTREREADRGGVYYASADGISLREVIYPMLVPNGIGLSPDGGTLYVAETFTARLWAFEITAPGEIRREPWPSPNGGRLVAGLGGHQWFDSLAVEESGAIAIATLIAGVVTVLSPKGEILERVPFPDLYTSNICFGGDDMRTAYVTLSNSGRLVAVDWPRPGLRLAYNAG